MRAQQRNLFEYFDLKETKRRYGRTQHGGLNSKGRRKQERPLSTKKWIHLVLKSDKAKGRLSFLNARNQPFVEATMRTKAKRFGVKIAEMVNVGSHLHVKIRVASRATFQRFLKAVTTLIARHVTGARRANPSAAFGKGSRLRASYARVSKN